MQMGLFSTIAGAVFIALGVFIFVVATLGIFRFDYVLNRVHVAAKCDSFAILLICVGLMFFAGSIGAILKLAIIIAIVWLVNPVASHLICKIEVETNKNLSDECEVESLP